MASDASWSGELISKLAADIFAKYDEDGDGMLQYKDYDAFCRDIYFTLELSEAEYAEQCKGLGCELSAGVDAKAFETLYTEFGRDVVADYALLFPLGHISKKYSPGLARFGILLSHLYA